MKFLILVLLGLGLRTWFLLAASKELNIFCSSSPQRHVLVLTIFGGKESEVQHEPFAASREMEGGKLVGGEPFLSKTKCFVSIPFRRKKKKKKKERKHPRTKRSCFHSFAELNHVLNLYVCTKQIFVSWSFITFTPPSAPTAEAQVMPQDRTPRGVPSTLEATAREPKARKVFTRWPSSQRDELPYFHKGRKSSDYKDNS